MGDRVPHNHDGHSDHEKIAFVRDLDEILSELKKTSDRLDLPTVTYLLEAARVEAQRQVGGEPPEEQPPLFRKKSGL
jgi:hypothetical protein